jgi:hypothetical protein
MEKNIYQKSENSFFVYIGRKKNIISKTFNDLNEAIHFRDQVLDFYDQNGVLPELSSVSKPRSLPGSIYFGDDGYQVRLSRKGKNISKNFRDLSEAESFRDSTLDYYNQNGVLPGHEEDLSKYKHIHKVKNLYVVQVKRDKKRIQNYFNNLNQAIYFRDQVLAFYDDFGELPNERDIKLIKLTM